MGLFDGIKKVAKGAVKTIKYMQYEKRVKEAILYRFPMSKLEGICRARGISLQVEGKRGKRRARSKDEIVPKLMHLDLDEIIELARRHKIKIDDILLEFEEFKKKLEE